MNALKTLITTVAMSALAMLLFWGFAVGTRITKIFWISDIFYLIQGLCMLVMLIAFVFLIFYIFYKLIEGGLDDIKEDWNEW